MTPITAMTRHGGDPATSGGPQNLTLALKTLMKPRKMWRIYILRGRGRRFGAFGWTLNVLFFLDCI